MKRPPQIAEELEKEVDKLLFLEVLVFKFSNCTTHFVIFFVVTDFFCSYFLFTGEEEEEAGPDSILYSWS